MNYYFPPTRAKRPMDFWAPFVAFSDKKNPAVGRGFGLKVFFHSLEKFAIMCCFLCITEMQITLFL